MSQQSNGNNNDIAECVSSITSNARELERKKLELFLNAKYTKIEYEKLCKTNAALEKENANLEKHISKMEAKLPESIELLENVKKSRTITDNVMDYLIQYRTVVQKDEANWKQKFDDLITDFENDYQELRKTMEDKSEIYKIYQREVNEEKALEIQNRIVLKKIDEQKNKIILRKEINRKLFNNQIVNFAKAVTMYRRNEIVDKEIAEKSARIQSLLKELNNEPSTIVQQVQYNKANPLDDILSRGKSPAFFPNLPAVQKPTDQPPTDNNQKQTILLKELRERLNKGKKIPLQQNDSSSSLMSITQQDRQSQKKNTLQPTDSSSSLKSVQRGCQTLKRNMPPTENPTSKKVQILQDINVPNTVVKPSNLLNNSQIQKKTPKKVSFAMPQQRAAMNKTMEDNSMISSQNSFTEKNNKSPFFKPNASIMNLRDENTQRKFMVPNRMSSGMSSNYKHDDKDRQDLTRQGQEKMDESHAMERSSVNFLDSSRMQGFMSSEFDNTNYEITGTAEEMNELMNDSQSGLNESVLSTFDNEDDGAPAFNNDFNFSFGFGGGSQPTSSGGQQFFF